MSLPVCPECGGRGFVLDADWTQLVWCRACGGSGVALKLIEAAREALEGHGLLGARIDAMARDVVLAIRAVLDKEGTLSVYPKEAEARAGNENRPSIDCHICGRPGGHHKWDCTA